MTPERSTVHPSNVATNEALAMNDLRQVRHCPSCHAPMIAVPVLTCAHCGEGVPLRCFTYSPRPNQYIAECIDLDLLSQGNTLEEAIGKLQEAMQSYLEAAFDGESTKGLVLRPSPLSHRLRYYLHTLRCRIAARFRGHHSKHLLSSTPELGKQRLSHC